MMLPPPVALPPDTSAFDRDGYLLLPNVLAAAECAALAARIRRADSASGGTRRMLDRPWCAALAGQLHRHPAVAACVPPSWVAVQCTYFEKSARHNWGLPLHRDLVMPVAERVDHLDLGGWSRKEGLLFVHPPAALLRPLVALRLHLDPCGPRDGPVHVVPGSHTADPTGDAHTDTPVPCLAEPGTVLLMRPLLLHGSARAQGTSLRRVLHFLWGPPTLPLGLRWPQAA